MLHTRVHIYKSSLRCIANVCMNIHSGSVFIAPRMCTYTKQLTLHCTCVCVYTQDRSSPLHTCVHTQELVMLHTCVHTQSSLRCIANVYEYTLRIGFHRSTHVYIHKTQLALHCTCVCVYTQDRSSPLHTCVHTQELVMLHTCVHIQSSLRCIANVYEYTLRIGFHRSTHVYIHKNAACAALHMCMSIHSGSGLIAPRMCTYTSAAPAALHV